MNSIVYLILLSLAAYLVGGIPFGLLVGYAVARKDVRDYGSGNIGMTNVWRTFGAIPGLATLILDAAKGYLPVYLATVESFYNLFEPLPVQGLVVIIGTLVILGHSFPVFLGFKGGRGVATGLGVMFVVLGPWLALPIVVFVLAVALTRYVSLGSILGAASVPLVVFFTHDARFDSIYYQAFSLLIGLLVILRHLPNNKRLVTGTENRFDFKRGKASPRVVDWNEPQSKDRQD